ncbi:corticosteroid- binding protein [Desmophyllum pertusum]|uniref:Corticosteroid- binding protein n=1 Tax=Desmophyllum pertusum TaxID=174260 RepID=A0A9W9YKH3_9CNID|nr:corticosteroid- binding protein [Desmophyllum pertusum]
MCCECYPGDRPLSEEESSNVATYLEGRSSELRAFLDIHSYSQLMLSPWGWTNEVPQEYRQMKALMKAATDAIHDTTGKVYAFGRGYSTIYPTYGDTIDYTYGNLGVIHSYCLELRPGENEPNGFLLPSCEIITTGREIMAALKAITPILANEKVTVGEDNGRLKRIKEKRREKHVFN